MDVDLLYICILGGMEVYKDFFMSSRQNSRKLHFLCKIFILPISVGFLEYLSIGVTIIYVSLP